jgi:transcriptional regulator with XRE-family HTH domain
MTNTTTPHVAWTTGDRLRKAREAAGIRSQEMANKLRVSRNSITNYERRDDGVPFVVILAWSEITGVPAAWLDTGDESTLSTWMPSMPGQQVFALPHAA